ncbi:dehydrogenase/reductase SDR family member 11-like [Asterias rubens]|uniref:dehydrogenase/reductase SDR family member 11-like n=1 Tax=Asterias rubens TaxID=7604 RepID=UPI0014558C2A|nr:dehydrogenase/reductase SDR family member 11-like [Asterias rubens]
MAGTTDCMQRWVGHVALVTGASTGIGQGIARSLVKHGMKVIGCARNIKAIQDDMQMLSSDSSISGSLHAIKCDLTKEDEILAMFAEIKEKFGGVDVCINNAGLNHARSIGAGSMGILNGETDKWRNMLELNVLAPAVCTREAVKQMEEKGTKDGQIIMIGSLSGHRITQLKEIHFYCVTKYGITAMIEGIRIELREKNSRIRVAAISPGIVETEFRQRMYPDEDPEKANKLYRTMEEPLQVDDIAEAVLYILQTPPHVQVHDIMLRPTAQKT